MNECVKKERKNNNKGQNILIGKNWKYIVTNKKRVKLKNGITTINNWENKLMISNKKFATERGITLLALIITVVIMLILAAVTINVTLGDGGLIDQAKHAAEKTQEATREEQEQLDDLTSQLNEIISGIGGGTGGVTNSTSGGETNTVPGGDTNSIPGGDTNSVDTNTIEPEPEPEPLPDNTVTISQPQWQEDGTATVIVSTTTPEVTIEYQIGGTEEGSWTAVSGGAITDIENGETVYVRITNGEQSSNPQEITVKDETNPTVTVSPQGSATTNSISVSVSAEDKETGMADSLTYTYYIKESGQPDTSYTAPENAQGITQNNYTFTGLKAGVSYDIKVEVNGDKAGNVGTGTLTGQSTGTIPGGDESVEQGKITFGPANWSNGKASITISTDTGLQIQYQKNATEDDGWESIDNNGTVSDLEVGDTVYARLTDGNNYGDFASTNILDNEAPAKASIQPSKTSLLIGESLTATVTHSDAKSGVDISKSGWGFNTNASAMGTDNTGAYTGKFSSAMETIKLDSSKAGTYYLHVLTTDVAGNKTETVSSAITISSITGTVTQSGSVIWSSGKASISLATTASQYKIVYKINDAGSWTEYNGTSITGLSHGDKVTACLTNASQTTYGPEATFNIQDTTNPTVTVSAQGSPTTNSITVTAVASDAQSGMVASPKYTFQYKASGAGSYTTPSDASDISNATYTLTGLTQGTTYDIQVIVNGDNAGNSGTGTTQATTTTVPGASEGLQTGNITASPVTWSGGKASTTLTTTTNFKIQYQVNGTSGSWSTAANSPVTVSNLNHNDTVYARLTDGTNPGSHAAINIIDGINPTVSLTVGTITETSIAVSVNASDGQSGLAESGTYKYYLNNSLKQTTTERSYTFTGLTGGTKYTIKVEAVDKAGRTGSDTKEATTEVPSISDTESQVANYADVDGNGTVDGVIYADLAVGGSGTAWEDRDGTYTIPTSGNFKKYKVTQESYAGSFGTGKVIAPVDPSSSSGNERFYVIALGNVGSGIYVFWNSSTSVVTSTEFGTGETNTVAMKAKGSIGLWSISEVQNGTWNGSSGWYVPSREEWSAFVDQLNITTSNYLNYGLSDYYWSSSQDNTGTAWSMNFDKGYVSSYDYSIGSSYIRLGTTF